MNLCKVILLGFLLFTTVVPDSFAAGKKSYAMSKKVFIEIEKVNVFLDQDKYLDAKVVLTKLLKKRLSKYEKAQVKYMLGSIEFQQGNPVNALSDFKEVLIAEGEIPELLYIRTLKTLAQLSLIQDELKNAKTYTLKLIEVNKDKPTAENYALLAQINYRLNDYPATVESINKSLGITSQKNKKPNENVLLLLNSAYFEMKSYQQMLPTLEQLIKLYPKPMYMLYLASIYGQLDQVDKQTVLMESLYENGDLKKSVQLINLANLYLSEKVPYKAASVLEKAIDDGVVVQNIRNLEMLSQAWMLAGNSQKSIATLALAAQKSEDGKLFFKKAYLHYNIGEWKDAEKSVFLALDKGLEKDKDIGEAWILVGMVRFNMQQFDKAILACEKALNIPSSREFALSWIKYIKSEQTKYEYMLEAIK